MNEKVEFGVLIFGVCGSGKTTLARNLLMYLGKRNIEIGIIHGDYCSLVIYGADFSERHLSVKYKNIQSLITNIGLGFTKSKIIFVRKLSQVGRSLTI